jgi:hypothetical protein
MVVGGNLVSWKRKKQHVIARSSSEAKYCAMTFASCELIWLKNLLADLGSRFSQSYTNDTVL